MSEISLRRSFNFFLVVVASLEGSFAELVRVASS
jgi:hypothetical protein